MGYAKYREDDIEISGERLKNAGIIDVKQNYISVDIIRCPYCGLPCHDRNDMYLHIKFEHDVLHPLFVVNEKVVNLKKQLDCFYLHEVFSAHIFQYGFNETISVNGMLVESENSDDIEITETINCSLDSQGYCVVDIGGYAIKIMRYSISSVNEKTINQIVNDWDRSVGNNVIKLPNLEQLNEAERAWLNGFFNYYVACTASDPEKSERYSEAYSILSSFEKLNAKGNCILKIIAFKLNWINILLMRCGNEFDDFKKYCNVLLGQTQENECDVNESFNEIYIEDELADNLNAFVNVFENDMISVEKYLDDFSDYELIKDANFRERILLLKMFVELKKDNRTKAKRYYREIGSPFFIKEFEKRFR